MNKITLELTIEECNLILQGLGELPAKMSLVMIQKIQSQAQSQMKIVKDDEDGHQ